MFGSTRRRCPAIYLAPRNRRDCICAIKLLGICAIRLLDACLATGGFLNLFLSQGFAHALRFTERFMNIFVG